MNEDRKENIKNLLKRHEELLQRLADTDNKDRDAKKELIQLILKKYEKSMKKLSEYDLQGENMVIVKGKYAKEILEDIMREPSPEAIERNKRASDLVKKLRK